MKKYKLRLCPVCDGNNKELLFTQEFSHINNVTFLQEYEVVKCKRCGFLYADNIPNQDVFDEYYEERSKYEIDNSNMCKGEYFNKVFSFMEKCILKDGRNIQDLSIVDVGCAMGDFLQFLKNKKIDRLYGIDPSVKCVDYLNSLCGIRAEKATINELDCTIKYDFVRVNMVLEHIVNLNDAIVKLKNIMKDDGYLYVSVPNTNKFFLTINSPFQEFSVEHINYFTLKTLESLFKKMDLR